MLDRPIQAAAEGLPKIQIDVLKARRTIEAHIERLIALLDALDGDPDLEPALGWTLAGPQHLSEASHNDVDREWDDEREWDPAEMGIADMDGALEQCPGFSLPCHGSVQ